MITISNDSAAVAKREPNRDPAKSSAGLGGKGPVVITDTPAILLCLTIPTPVSPLTSPEMPGGVAPER
jgi:hypothetical protein